MFYIHTTDDGRQLPTEYLPCSAIAPKYGQAMYMSGGVLAVAGGTNKAEYISVQNEENTLTAGDACAVVKIQKDQVWRAPKDTAAEMTVGTGYDVTEDGLGVDADGTTTGNFVVTAVEDQAAGGLVFGRFAV